MFDLDLLPTFAVFAKTLNFTETGRTCGLTQPAAHGQIKRLSSQIGEDLYRREGRSLLLTQRGEALAALARDVVRSRDTFLGAPVRLRLAAGRGTWMHLLLPRLDLEHSPFQPLLADGPTATRMVLDGHAELGVATDPPPLRTLPLAQIGTHVLLHPTHPLVDQKELSLEQLSHDPWILPSPGRPHRLDLEARFRALSLTPEVTIACDDWDLTAAFVAKGFGVSAVNAFVTHPDVVAIPLKGGGRAALPPVLETTGVRCGGSELGVSELPVQEGLHLGHPHLMVGFGYRLYSHHPHARRLGRLHTGS